jgi:hypothetical protein
LYNEPVMIIIFTIGLKPVVMKIIITIHFHHRVSNLAVIRCSEPAMMEFM